VSLSFRPGFFLLLMRTARSRVPAVREHLPRVALRGVGSVSPFPLRMSRFVNRIPFDVFGASALLSEDLALALTVVPSLPFPCRRLCVGRPRSPCARPA